MLVPLLPLAVAAVLATSLPAPFDRRRRALHDLVAGTVVVSYRRDDRPDNDPSEPGLAERPPGTISHSWTKMAAAQPAA
jgi:uncharacterized RDD family membrane protein YckC